MKYDGKSRFPELRTSKILRTPRKTKASGAQELQNIENPEKNNVFGGQVFQNTENLQENQRFWRPVSLSGTFRIIFNGFCIVFYRFSTGGPHGILSPDLSRPSRFKNIENSVENHCFWSLGAPKCLKSQGKSRLPELRSSKILKTLRKTTASGA